MTCKRNEFYGFSKNAKIEKKVNEVVSFNQKVLYFKVLNSLLICIQIYHNNGKMQ